MHVRLKFLRQLLVAVCLPCTGIFTQTAQDDGMKRDAFNMNPEGLKDFWYSMTVKALLKAKARTIFAQLPFSEKVVYEQCESDASSVLELARCVVALLDERDRIRLQRTEERWNQWSKAKPIAHDSAAQLQQGEPMVRALAGDARHVHLAHNRSPLSPTLRRLSEEDEQAIRPAHSPVRIDGSPGAFLRQIAQPISPSLRQVKIRGNWTEDTQQQHFPFEKLHSTESSEPYSKKPKHGPSSPTSIDFSSDAAAERLLGHSYIPEAQSQDLRFAPKKAAIRSRIYRLPQDSSEPFAEPFTQHPIETPVVQNNAPLYPERYIVKDGDRVIHEYHSYANRPLVTGISPPLPNWVHGQRQPTASHHASRDESVPNHRPETNSQGIDFEHEVEFVGSYGEPTAAPSTVAPHTALRLPGVRKVKRPGFPNRLVPAKEHPIPAENQARGIINEVVIKPVPLGKTNADDFVNDHEPYQRFYPIATFIAGGAAVKTNEYKHTTTTAATTMTTHPYVPRLPSPKSNRQNLLRSNNPFAARWHDRERERTTQKSRILSTTKVAKDETTPTTPHRTTTLKFEHLTVADVDATASPVLPDLLEEGLHTIENHPPLLDDENKDQHDDDMEREPVLYIPQKIRITAKEIAAAPNHEKTNPIIGWFSEAHMQRKKNGVIRRRKRENEQDNFSVRPLKGRHEGLTEKENLREAINTNPQHSEVVLRENLQPNRKQPPNFSLNPSAKIIATTELNTNVKSEREDKSIIVDSDTNDTRSKHGGISKRKIGSEGLDMQIKIKVNPHEATGFKKPNRLEGVRALIFDRRNQILFTQDKFSTAPPPKLNKYGISRYRNHRKSPINRNKREAEQRANPIQAEVHTPMTNASKQLSARLNKIADNYMKRLKNMNEHNSLHTIFDKNSAKLAKVKNYFDGVERYNAYVSRMNDANMRFISQHNLPIKSRIDHMPDLKGNSLVSDMLALINNFQMDVKKLSIASPRILSLFPETKTRKKPRVLSPTLLSFHRDGMLSLPDLFKLTGNTKTEQNFWLDMMMELSGASLVLDELITSMGSQMDRFVDHELPLLKELETQEQKWSTMASTYTTHQQSQLNGRGYTFMEPHQAKILYSDSKDKDNLKLSLDHYAMMSEEERDARIEQDIRQMANLSKTIGKATINGSMIANRRVKRQGNESEGIDNEPGILINGVTFETLIPYAFSNVINHGAALEFVTLSPSAFIGEITSPEALAMITLSPRAFIATVLSPVALIARTLSPSAFRAEVLAPRAFVALTLSPQAMLAEVLSPRMFEAKVLSPEALIIYILNPSLMSPYVDSPEAYGVLVLSPHILSPRIRSREHMIVEVLSPHILGGEHSHEEAEHEVVEVGAHTAEKEHGEGGSSSLINLGGGGNGHGHGNGGTMGETGNEHGAESAHSTHG